MIRLLKIELNKLRTYRAFWVLTIMYFVGLAGTLLSIQGIFNAFLDDNVPSAMQGGMRWDFYSLPDGWHYMSWIASLFNYLLPIVVVIIVSAEFTYKTVRQNIITGMSRVEWMAGKLILMTFFALASTLVLLVITVGLGLFNSELSDGTKLLAQSGYILGYFIQTTGYLIFAMLLSIIIRNTGVVIGIMMIYSLFLERVLYAFLPDGWERFFPLRAFSNLVAMPFDLRNLGPTVALPIPELVIALAYIGLFAGMGFWILKRRDL